MSKRDVKKSSSKISAFPKLFSPAVEEKSTPLRRQVTGMVKRFISQMRSFGTFGAIST